MKTYRTPGKTGHKLRWEDNIQRDLEETWRHDLDKIHVVHDKDQ
jgi:hypothetical protein